VITRTPFGALPDGRPVHAFTLTNAAGVELRAITVGGVIASLHTPDRRGEPGDIVLGHDAVQPYLDGTAYLGAIVGRHANRIARGRLVLDGRVVQLTINDGRNHLHGGRRGFDKQLWNGEEVRASGGDGVRFSRVSPDGEEGYTGTLRVRVQYLLTDENELRIDYEAESDAPTVVNLTQHSYFDLSCGAADDIGGHLLTLHADAYTAVDAELIPTGDRVAVEGTPFDFRMPTPIGARIAGRDVQLQHGLGYDHNWVLRRPATQGVAPAASVLDPISGRTLEVLTTEPGIQFYSGNQLDGTIIGKQGRRYGARAGFCLETQHFPDGPNQPSFPSPVLRPGELFRSRTVLRFGVDSRR
jgi:aldose 1-epimerase